MSQRLFALLRAAVFATAFIWIWTWFFPRWFARSKGVELELRPGIAAIALMIIGGAIMLYCVWAFAWTGRGTPAPWDPPRRLVVKGLYRWVRNPMYVGMGLVHAGIAARWESTWALLMLVPAVAAVDRLIIAREERYLERKFGEDYRRYKRRVRRWL